MFIHVGAPVGVSVSTEFSNQKLTQKGTFINVFTDSGRSVSIQGTFHGIKLCLNIIDLFPCDVIFIRYLTVTGIPLLVELNHTASEDA